MHGAKSHKYGKCGAICCSKCREHSDETDSERQSLIHDPTFALDEKQQSLN